MRIRKNANKMSETEKQRFINGLKSLKATVVNTLSDGTVVSFYDQLVALHLGVTQRLDAFGNFQGDGAHGGPAFLPWHRQYLMVLENALRTVDSRITIPYWDWLDRDGNRDILFTDGFMGPSGQGSGPIGRVRSGPFTRNEGWPIIDEIHRPNTQAATLGQDLLRATTLRFDQLPTAARVNQILGRTSYMPNVTGRGFFNDLERDPHGTLHIWTGGRSLGIPSRGTMSGMSSPNDPIFYLHHSQVDRIWAIWQDGGFLNDYPTQYNTAGHGLSDPMWPWDGGRLTTLPFILKYLPGFMETVRPSDVLDFRALGFIYDDLLPELRAGETINNVVLETPGDQAGFQLIVETAGRFAIQTQGTSLTAELFGPDDWQLRQRHEGGDSMVAELQPGNFYLVFQHSSALGTGTFSVSVDAQPNGDPGPNPVIPRLQLGGSPVMAEIGSEGERDLFQFMAPSRGLYTLETSGPTDIFMSLYGPDRWDALVTEDDDSGQQRNARIASNLSAGTYQVEVRHYWPTGTGHYGISARYQPFSVPIIQVDGPEVQGDIAAEDESDLYSFQAEAQGTYTIETSGSTDTFITLFGPDEQTRLIARDDDSGTGTLSRISENLEAGAYFVSVRHYSPRGTGPYGLRVKRDS